MKTAPLRGKALKRLEDGLDAITCAVVARKANQSTFDVFGNVESGYIVVPKREELGPCRDEPI